MTQEDKELLLKDLSSRLGYGTKMQVYYEDIGGCGYFDEEISSVDVESEYINDRWPDYIKPYLRPLSSMTEEESEEYNDLTNLMSDYDSTIENIATKIIDWLNSHRFDYRGLIEKKLALEAPEGMYGES
jgi:hypothetical protein